jgi:energy-coupling factor transport system permease protein
MILTFSAAFNALSVHAGETVLFRLPEWPLVGGPVTLEAIVFGLAGGLVLVTLLSLFTVFNRVIAASDLARMIPNAFHDLGLVVLIAVTYVPEVMHQFQRVREAQAIRGHRLRGLRDLQPILIPLLIGSLERAMILAETMVARGYGATVNRQQSPTTQILLVTALLLALGGWFLTLFGLWMGRIILVSGLGLLIFLLWRQSRLSQRTQYRPVSWQRPDTVMILAALVPLAVVLLPLPFVDRASLLYSPYLRLHLPAFNPVVGLSIMFLLFPIWRGIFAPTYNV